MCLQIGYLNLKRAFPQRTVIPSSFPDLYLLTSDEVPSDYRTPQEPEA